MDDVGALTFWDSPAGRDLARQVVQAKFDRSALRSLGLAEHLGRIDLRGFRLPEPPSRTEVMSGAPLRIIDSPIALEGAVLDGLDLSGSVLSDLRLLKCTIRDCAIDHARLVGLRAWATDIASTTFLHTSFRNVVLGAWMDGRGGIISDSQFDGADLLRVVCATGTFRQTDFGTARIRHIDFQSTCFDRCRFAGRLADVMFWDRGYGLDKREANEMADVDFSDADLRQVEFRRLNLDRVKLPTSSAHLTFEHPRCVLERSIRDIPDRQAWKPVRATLQHYLKWLGPRQIRSVVHRADLREMFGTDIGDAAAQIIEAAATGCEKRSGG